MIAKDTISGYQDTAFEYPEIHLCDHLHQDCSIFIPTENVTK